MDNNIELETRVEVISPETAARYLVGNTMNRPVNQKLVRYYADVMRKEQWELNGESIKFAEDGTLLDGQHRLKAVILSSTSVPFLVVRKCQKKVFTTIDSGRCRRPGDVFALSKIPNYSNISAMVSKYLLLKIGNRGIGNRDSIRVEKHVTKRDLLDEYEAKADLYQQAHIFSSSCYKKLAILTSSEIGAIYVFLHFDRKHPIELIESFFTMLHFGTDVSNSTITLLRDRLISAKIQKQGINSRYKDMLLRKTWNSFVRGDNLRVLKWNESSEGILQFI